MKEKYYGYCDLMKDIEALVKEYPAATVSVIGRSLVGREIPLIRLGHGKKSVLYVGAHHGMEYLTSLLLMRYVGEVCTAAKAGGDILGHSVPELLERRSIFVVPMLNPDGVELQTKGEDKMNPLYDRLHRMSGGDYSRWQANGRGVDLNHNYNAGFEEYKTIERELGIAAGATKYSGDRPESEPETACICSFMRMTEISLLIALHTQGSEIYYGYNGHIPRGTEAIARKMERLSGYRLSSPEGTACYGGLKDYFTLEYDRPAFTIECGKGENPLPLSQADSIYSVIRGILHLCPTYI